MKNEYNERYLAYCKLKNTSPEEMFEKDNSSMVGYIIFIDTLAKKYRKASGLSPTYPIGRSEEFTWFINNYVEKHPEELLKK